jgi:hypothetical protein
MALIPNDIEKILRDQYILFIDTTPNSTNTWKPVGIGVTDLSISYNPQVETEKWILERNSRSDHTGNQKQTTVTQKAYKNDPVFTFVEAGRDELNYKTNILEVDVWNGSGTGTITYPAKKSEGIITVTSYMGDSGQIEYDLYFSGDAIEGTVTMSDGVPSFTPSVSL